MKIVDAFTFYNELELLNYRLSVLYDVVDYFIIVEATHTHVGKKKPLYFNENKDKFSKFMNKIIHIVDDALIEDAVISPSNNFDDEVWKNENHQRNHIDIGIKKIDLDKNDIIIISDLDEIPDDKTLKILKDNNTNISCITLIQDFYYYNLTCKNKEKWSRAKIVSYDYYINEMNSIPQNCRLINTRYYIKKGGWHLSYFGDSSFIKNKLEHFSHQEFNDEKYKNEEIIKQKINNNEDLFSRNNEQWITIPISENDYLPTKYDIYLQNFIR